MNGVRIPYTTGAVCVRSVRGSDPLLGEQPPLRETVRRQDGTVEAQASEARVRRLKRTGEKRRANKSKQLNSATVKCT